jgi:hypothetical protein
MWMNELTNSELAQHIRDCVDDLNQLLEDAKSQKLTVQIFRSLEGKYKVMSISKASVTRY